MKSSFICVVKKVEMNWNYYWTERNFMWRKVKTANSGKQITVVVIVFSFRRTLIRSENDWFHAVFIILLTAICYQNTCIRNDCKFSWFNGSVLLAGFRCNELFRHNSEHNHCRLLIAQTNKSNDIWVFLCVRFRFHCWFLWPEPRYELPNFLMTQLQLCSSHKIFYSK